MLLFASPKCPFCLKLLPTWKTLADKAKQDDFLTGAINCLLEPKFCKRFGITQYPTIFLKKSKFYFKFKGNRSLDRLVNFYKTKFKDIKPRSFNDIIKITEDQLTEQSLIYYIIKHSPLTLIKTVCSLISLILIIGAYFLIFYEVKHNRKRSSKK